jgi:tRNA A37 threonylcarbamoyladenosine modification protein TsaB
MATARGLALSIGRPVTGFSTLETIAHACVASWPQASRVPICVVLDAGKGEVYRGLFGHSGDEIVALEPEAAMEPREAVGRLPGSCLLCGDGARACRAALPAGDFPGRILMETVPFIGLTLARRALSLAASLGPAGMPPLVPNYLRPSDAEVHYKG